MTLEQEARAEIDRLLTAAGWHVCASLVPTAAVAHPNYAERSPLPPLGASEACDHFRLVREARRRQPPISAHKNTGACHPAPRQTSLTGHEPSHAKDALGRVYGYQPSQVVSAEGKTAGQLYLSPRIVRCIAEMLTPYKGALYLHASSSGCMSVQSQKFAILQA